MTCVRESQTDAVRTKYNIERERKWGDLDGNGKYDIKDFLEMKNSELLKMNQGKKFDICLMNPPYGTRGGDDIHFKFTEKCI